MKKIHLMTPGPCPVPPSVRQALALPVIHHRSNEYHELHRSVSEGLRQVFKTRGDILIFASSGSGAMEGAVVNTLSPGDNAAVIRGGKFAERWEKICNAYGAGVIPIDVAWGEAVRPESVAAVLAKHPGVRAVFATLCETSTTVKHDIEALAKITSKTGTLLVVDSISGLATVDLRMDDWGVDVAVAAGQKGLMIPTGLAVAAVGSEKAWGLIQNSRMPKYYFDWKLARAAAEKNETVWSAPASAVVALNESLKMILAEGVDNVLARHARLGKACRAGVSALGLKLLAPGSPSDGVTGVWVPDGISGVELKKTLHESFGVIVAGGQEKLKGKIIRIAHTGYVDISDVVTAISSLELSLKALGYPVEPGKGVKAAEEAYVSA
jgi:aspartate aminotransferase-like enzyme